MPTCTRCDRELALTNFYASRSVKGYWPYCKTCDYVRQRTPGIKVRDLTPEITQPLLARYQQLQERKAQATCSVPECDAECFAKGLCTAHYFRERRSQASA